jgi:4-hydroxythreonine-4-phosphate dehydrogenase
MVGKCIFAQKKTLDYKQTKLGISLGDYNGISMEILLKAFSHDSLFQYCTPVLYATSDVFKFYSKLLGIDNVRFQLITDTADCRPGYINIKTISKEMINITPGEASNQSGEIAVASLKSAIEDVKKGQIHNLLTLPINKDNSHSAEFQFSGHTDFLANTFEVEDYMMILVSDEMKMGMVTGHLPIKDVAKNLTKELVTSKITTLLQSLKLDFAITKPKIAVLGLNPHSGDNGLIGTEEKEILQPVIKDFVDRGELIYGPYPADGFFGKKQYSQFDAVLAMYHDQGLIPFKQLSFSDGVNYTAGLPIVRTSPDHGTAFDIAGKNQADSSSMVNAIFLLKKIYCNRVELMDLNKNPLPFSKHRREKFSIGVPNLK